MKRLYQSREKLLLFLIMAILTLCVGFLIIGCGNSPQQKVKDTDKGSYAIDFSLCPGDKCAGEVEGTDGNPLPSIEGKEFTVEAWVKRSPDSTLNGGIFGRFAAKGFGLYVKNNVPKFVIRRVPTTGDELLANRTAVSECFKLGTTTTECVVQAVTAARETNNSAPATLAVPDPPSNWTDGTATTTLPSRAFNSESATSTFTLTNMPLTYGSTSTQVTMTVTLDNATANGIILGGNTVQFSGPGDTPSITVTSTKVYAKSLVADLWTHIAGVLTTEDHSNVNKGNCPTVGAEQPHLAIYINGELNNCATTNEQYAKDPTAGINFTLGKLTPSEGELLDDLYPIENDEITGSMNFEGAIDEVRLWTTARTEDQIKACMNQELGMGGTCDRLDSNLIGYWRLNEGEGAEFTDFSGYGYTGILLSKPPGVGIEWEDGWISGVTGLSRAD
jgi:hypothetical protein